MLLFDEAEALYDHSRYVYAPSSPAVDAAMTL